MSEDDQQYTKINILNSSKKLIHKDSNNFKISEVEKKYSAVYLGEFCLKSPSEGWMNQAYSLFYTPKAHPQGSNYFALYYMWDLVSLETGKPKLYITNGISAVVDPETGDRVIYTGVDCGDDEILYSAYRHDYQTYKDFMIDGGRDYTKRSMNGNLVSFKIVDDQIVLED